MIRTVVIIAAVVALATYGLFRMDAWFAVLTSDAAFRDFVLSPLFPPAVIVATLVIVAAIFLTGAAFTAQPARPSGRNGRERGE